MTFPKRTFGGVGWLCWTRSSRATCLQQSRPRPSAQGVEGLADWIKGRVARAEDARRALQGRVVLRRLNRNEYANTVRDLLGVQVDLKDLLPLSTSTSGFDNSRITTTSPMWMVLIFARCLCRQAAIVAES